MIQTSVHFLVICLLYVFSVEAVYEKNPFFSNKRFFNFTTVRPPLIQNGSNWQILVTLPPGSIVPQHPTQGDSPPGPPLAGFIWVQVPAIFRPGQSSASGGSTGQNITQQTGTVSNAKPLQQVQPTFPTINQITTQSQINQINTQQSNGDLNRHCLRSTGLFPSIECDKYLNCWNGVAVEQKCAPGLLFNSKGYCDYPSNVECGKKVSEGDFITDNQVSSSLGSSSTNLSTQTLLPSGNSPPSQTQSSSIIHLPVLATSIPFPAKEQPVDPSLRLRCLSEKGQFPSGTCDKYVNCWGDSVIEEKCPEGLLFSTKGYCDFPANVDCENRTSPQRITAPKAPECLKDSGTFRDKDNCSVYYVCSESRVLAKYICPDGFNFNGRIGVCDYAERVNCTEDPYVYPWKDYKYPELPEDVASTLQQCKPGTVIRLNPQCTAACVCGNNAAEVVRCPNGLAYDSSTKSCLPNYAAKC